jgi:hypothetical protein
MPSAAQMCIAKHGFVPKVNRWESAEREALHPDLRALSLKIDGCEAEIAHAGTMLPIEAAKLKVRLADLHLEFSRIALEQDTAALDYAEQALKERQAQDERDAAARIESEKDAARQAGEAEAAREVREHKLRLAEERRIARDPLTTRKRALTTELTDAKRQHAESVAKIDRMQREGFDETYPEFSEATKNRVRLAGYVSRINVDLVNVTHALDALPYLEV